MTAQNKTETGEKICPVDQNSNMSRERQKKRDRHSKDHSSQLPEKQAGEETAHSEQEPLRQNIRKEARCPFDPQDYLSDPDFTFWYHVKHLKVLERYRLGFYQLYSKLLRPEFIPHHEEEDKSLFLEFLNLFKSDMRISYGWLSYTVHGYLCYASLSRMLYCPTTRPVNLESWTAWLLPAWNPLCPSRPRSFVDWLGWLQVAYYWGMFISHHVNPGLEKGIAIFGTQILNGGLCTAFWFTPQSKDHSFWYLSGSSKFSGGMGSWRALYLPIIYLWSFLIVRGKYFGLVFWEYEESDLAQVDSGEYNIQDDSDLNSKEWEERLSNVHKIRLWIYRSFNVFSGLVPLLIWRIVLRPAGDTIPASFTDLHSWPSSLFLLPLILCITVAFGLWISFLLFQHKIIAWSIPLREGLVFDKDDRELKVGLIY